MAKILIVSTKRYSINACDFDLFFRNSSHEIVSVLYHRSIEKKSWWNNLKNCPAHRSGVMTKLKKHKCIKWDTKEDLLNKINKIEFDYLCLGNGNDEIGLFLQKKLNCKFIFSEYGWLGTPEVFFFDTKGCGAYSSIRDLNLDEELPAKQDDMDYVKQKLKKGNSVDLDNFIYIPLQVDSPTSDGKKDFKFLFTKFNSNDELLRYIQKIIPKDIKVLVKNHPSSTKPTKIPSGMIDISNLKLSKYELYSKMMAMIAINSTSVLEAMLFSKPIFTYGEDVFSGHNLTYENIANTDDLLNKIKTNVDYSKFLGCLFKRQINRIRCFDKNYVLSHCWNGIY